MSGQHLLALRRGVLVEVVDVGTNQGMNSLALDSDDADPRRIAAASRSRWFSASRSF